VCKPLDVCLPNGLAHSLGADHKFNLADKIEPGHTEMNRNKSLPTKESKIKRSVCHMRKKLAKVNYHNITKRYIVGILYLYI